MIATRYRRPGAGRARRHAAFALIAAAVLAACRSGQPAGAGDGDAAAAVFRTEEGTVRSGPLGLAETPAARARGLMGVEDLPPDGGMVFLFEGPTDGPFWMKDTPIPLSVAFWNEEGRILAILDMEPCAADPCRLYRPGLAYVGAVEMPQGWFGRHGVEVGDVVEVEILTR